MKNLFIVVTIIMTHFSFAQNPNRTITGKVTDINGNAISDAAICTLPIATNARTNKTGDYFIQVSDKAKYLNFSALGYRSKKVLIGKNKRIDVQMTAMTDSLNETVIIGYHTQKKESLQPKISTVSMPAQSYNQALQGQVAGLITGPYQYFSSRPLQNNESYSSVTENVFQYARIAPLSIFSIDVDAASYSNIRRFINNGNLPPIDAVRVEEMINYFPYNYPQPDNDAPINIITQVSNAPWNPKHQLVQIALQGKTISTNNLPPSNLTFLIDVSGSMDSQNKLPLLISSLKLLTDQLRPQDHVAIVTYAGVTGVPLPSTSGEYKTKIKDVLNNLTASGSTNGAGGIERAYAIASENFNKNGNNRIILCTDGDFNVGMSSDKDLETLI